MELKNVVLVDGARSAFARGGRGKLVATRLDTAGAQVVRALLDRNPKVKDTMIEDVGLGNVSGKGEFVMLGAVARLAGLPLESCSFSSNRQCGSSMETLHRIVMSIMVGATECGVALGIERMGRGLSGMGGSKKTRVSGFNERWLQQNDTQKAMAHDHHDYFKTPIPDYILGAPPMMPMTQTAQNVVDMFDLSREEMDAFAVRSHQLAAAATERGIYKDEIIPLTVENPVFNEDREWVEEEHGDEILFDKDECIRPDTDAATLASLNPIKGVQSYGQKEVRITAGNSCPTNDGISAALLMSEKKAVQLGLEPLARIRGIGVGGVKPQVMGLGPVVATKKALKHAGLEVGDIDRVEFNEAFAAQVLPSIRELGIAEDKVNVNGGSIALGHPLGATGARLVLAVAHELRRSGNKIGLGTQCIGAGMGISTVIEVMD